MVARTGYFSYQDVRKVLFEFDCNKINQLKKINPQKYIKLNSIHPTLPQDHFWSPLRADDLLVMNQLLRTLSDISITEGKHVAKLPLEIIDYIVKICLQSTPLISELWRIYIGSPRLRDSCRKSPKHDLEKVRIPDLCFDNKSLDQASKMLLIIYGEKPQNRDIHLSHFKQLLHYVFKDYFTHLDYKKKRKVLDKFSQVSTITELEQILKIPDDPKKKLQKLNEISSEIQKNVTVFEYLSIRRKFYIYYFCLIKIYAATNLLVFSWIALAFIALFITGFALLFYRYTILGILVVGFGFPTTSVCCLFLLDRFSEPQLSHSAAKSLVELIDNFVKEQIAKTVDRQLPILCEKWERVVLDLMPYVSHVRVVIDASFLY